MMLITCFPLLDGQVANGKAIDKGFDRPSKSFAEFTLFVNSSVVKRVRSLRFYKKSGILWYQVEL